MDKIVLESTSRPIDIYHDCWDCKYEYKTYACPKRHSDVAKYFKWEQVIVIQKHISNSEPNKPKYIKIERYLSNSGSIWNPKITCNQYEAMQFTTFGECAKVGAKLNLISDTSKGFWKVVRICRKIKTT